MKREIVRTRDGSNTVSIPEIGVTYHSLHGALTESTYIFIGHGLGYFVKKTNASVIRIFEMGFGTGLNALLAALYAMKNHLEISYSSVELFPLSPTEINILGYTASDDFEDLFQQIHAARWNMPERLNKYFEIHKIKADLLSIVPPESDVIFFDAFAPDVQPELWTEDIFSKIYYNMAPNGVFVTYSSKGAVRRALQQVGFKVEKLPGPPGKREIIRAVKSNF